MSIKSYWKAVAISMLFLLFFVATSVILLNNHNSFAMAAPNIESLAATSPVSAPESGAFTGNKSAELAGFSTVLAVLLIVGVIVKKKFAKSSVDFDKK